MTRWSLHESSATLSASTSSRCPSGCRLSSMLSLCSSQSSVFSTPGTTGAGERMPWRVAVPRATSLPSPVLGSPFGPPLELTMALLCSAGTMSIRLLLVRFPVSFTVRRIHYSGQALRGPDLVPLSGERIMQLYPDRVLRPAYDETTPVRCLEFDALLLQQLD